MTAQIRPNRMEVSDRFPMLGFSVRVDEPNVEAEVVLANDIALFGPEGKPRRNASNFYTSRENGTLMVPRGDGVFVVAPEVLVRFIGSDKLYFGLATGHTGNGGLTVDALPREGSPYVSLRATGRTLRRSGWASAARSAALEWTGDAPRPGSESAAPAGAQRRQRSQCVQRRTGQRGQGSHGAGRQPGPATAASMTMDSTNATDSRASAHRGSAAMGVPPHGHHVVGGTTAARDALNWIRRKVGRVAAVGSTPAALALPPRRNSGTFFLAWERCSTSPFPQPRNAFLAALPGLARDMRVTLSIGPALDTPVFGAGVGVVFAPNGQVALFGAGEISVDFDGLSEFVSSLKAALQAKMKLGYNSGGIDGFASLAKVASVKVGEELVVGAELWLDGSDSGIGGAVSIGVGLALQLAADRRGRAMAMDETGPAIVPPALPNDQRARATRIGGPFPGRVHEALDLGLNPKALDALLDTLDPPATPQPLTGPPPAQAMGAARRRVAHGAPVRRARQMDVGAAATIAGAPVTMITGNAGSISWNVPQWTGIKHPNGQPPAGEAVYQDGLVMLNEWPRIGGTAGTDDVYAWFASAGNSTERRSATSGRAVRQQ